MTQNSDSRDFFGHPRGLFVLFFTEMWERFSYYGMRALLIFYMTKYMLIPHVSASKIYGTYTSLVYLTPLIGGWLADRYFGQRRMVVVGGVLMAIGHFLMAFEPLFYPALGFLIVGNGAFKPNISTQVGRLYADGDPRRDRAFNIFYVGINVGSFLAPLVCGTLGELYGWHYGFGAAGVGMLAGLGVYLWGMRYLGADDPRPAAGEKQEHQPLTSIERKRLALLIGVCLAATLFWAIAEQDGNVMALRGDKDTDRHIFGWEMPATWIQSFNPAIIFLFTPLVTGLWAWLSKRDMEPASPVKMSIGLCLASVSCLVMAMAARTFAADGMPVSLLWIVGYYILLTTGELYLSPVGMSLVTKLAPKRMVSMGMGVWFLTSFGGSFLAGWLGSLWDIMQKDIYFFMLCGMSLAGLLFMIFLIRPVKRVLEDG